MATSTSLDFVGIGGDSPVAGISFEVDVADSNGSPQIVPKRVRRRLLETPENKPRTPSSLEEIEAKLKEADLRRQQFHEWLANKARPKPRSPTRSANSEDLAQCLEAKLYAVEQKRVRRVKNTVQLSKSCDDIFNKMIQSGTSPEDLYNDLCDQEVEIVLTAHPTQINRRTLQYKHLRIAHLLEYNDRADLSHEEREMLIEDLRREVTSLWQTDELRRQSPHPWMKLGLGCILWNSPFGKLCLTTFVELALS